MNARARVHLWYGEIVKLAREAGYDVPEGANLYALSAEEHGGTDEPLCCGVVLDFEIKPGAKPKRKRAKK